MADLDLSLPPVLKKGSRKRVTKKHHTTNNVPVDVSVRRQVAAEIGEDEPTKDQKFILLQKYGATTPRIDRLVTKPNWMGVKEWKRKLNDWFQMTKGLVRPEQRSRFNRPMNNSQQSRSRSQHHLELNPRYQRTPYPGQKAYRNVTPTNRRPDTRESHPNSGRTRTETLPN